MKSESPEVGKTERLLRLELFFRTYGLTDFRTKIKIACHSSFFKTAGVYLQNIHPHVKEYNK
jgi:hypothetical protein